MPKTIELIYDFVSPNAYLIWQPLREIAARQRADIKITAAFLGGMHKLTGNAPPFIRDAEVKGKNDYAKLEMQRFIEKHKLLRFRMNPKFPFNSITLLRMLVSLPSEEQIKFIEALSPAIWEDQLDVSDATALGAVLRQAGFDPDVLAAGLRRLGVQHGRQVRGPDPDVIPGPAGGHGVRGGDQRHEGHFNEREYSTHTTFSIADIRR